MNLPIAEKTQSDKHNYINSAVLERIKELYNLSIPDLIFQAQIIHRENHNPNKIQFCTLSSIKTGSCPEDCHYCPQSAHYKTDVESHNLLSKEKVLEDAQEAKNNGSTRFCMGASWRNLPNGKDFNEVVELIKGVKELDLEVCCTLGMLSEEQALKLKTAGLHTYNHNIDTSPEFYDKIISTRSFDERIQTLQNIQKAGIRVCSGGIIGMGESIEDTYQDLSVYSVISLLVNRGKWAK